MQAGRILGRDQDEENMGRIAVQRFEIHARTMASESADDPVGTAQLAVRNRDPVADRGRAEPLALAEYRGQVLEPDVRVFGRQSLSKFLEHLVLAASLQ